jgi:osmotically-inducible protein OsmY
MANSRFEPRHPVERRFENEPSDEWQEAYARGGPVRSDEPERDYYFENIAAPMRSEHSSEQQRQLRRMSWRAAGVQDYPGGSLEVQIAASHRGKGPKGYRPSDERLRERVCERLTDDPFIDATDIEVSVANGEITLSGSVNTRQMKYAVEDLIADMPGITTVHNSIQVNRTL